MGKLVRDKIPDIIRKSGTEPEIRVLSKAEYRQALFDKLIEEAKELRDAPEEAWQILELADVMEVIHAIHREFRWPKPFIEQRRRRRVRERGGFSKRLYLESTEE